MRSRELPAGRSLTAYASAAGVREVLAPRTGAAGLLGRLLDRPGLQAAGAALTGEDGGLRVTARVSGGAPEDAAFEPVLLERVPERAAAYLGVRSAAAAGGARRAAGRDAGRRAAPPAAAARGPDRRSTRTCWRRWTARSRCRSPGRREDPEGTAAGAPVVTLKARTADAGRTGAALARLQQPLAARLALPGTVPGFRPATIGGLDAFTLRATPQLAPSYAVSADGLVISTAPAGLLPPRGTLAAAPAFDATIGEVPDQADSLVFVDLRQLLALGEETGLTAISGLATARDDLRRVRAAGAVVTQDPAHPSDTTAELFLQIP